MSRDIPFFEMFTELQLSGELRLALAGAVINNACIDQAAMALVLHLTTQIELGEAEAAELKRLLSGVYGFQTVELEAVCKAPAVRAERPAPAAPARHAEFPRRFRRVGSADLSHRRTHA